MFLLITLWACVGDVEPVGTVTDDTAPPPDSGADTPGFLPIAFTVRAAFGLDRETDTLRAFQVDGTTVQPWVSLVAIDEAGTWCEVVMTLDAPQAVAVQTWSFTDATNDQEVAHLGFMVPDAVQIQTTEPCDDWATDTVGAIDQVLLPHAWGVGVGTLREDVAAEVAKADPDQDYLASLYAQGSLVGGSWSADLWTPDTWASHAAVGAAAPDWQVQVDAEGHLLEPYTAADYLTADGLPPTGVYLVMPVWAWPWEGMIPAPD